MAKTPLKSELIARINALEAELAEEQRRHDEAKQRVEKLLEELAAYQQAERPSRAPQQITTVHKATREPSAFQLACQAAREAAMRMGRSVKVSA